MIDRLVCADGGNPDPTSTGGKDPQRAKELELNGWPYPRHLAGRVFSVVVHGDADGVGSAPPAASTNWLTDMGLIEAGNLSQLGALCRLPASPMRPATRTSTGIRPFKRRYATPPARWSRLCDNFAAASSSRPTPVCIHRGKSDRYEPDVIRGRAPRDPTTRAALPARARPSQPAKASSRFLRSAARS